VSAANPQPQEERHNPPLGMNAEDFPAREQRWREIQDREMEERSKLPPNCIEIERALLGLILHRPKDAIPRIADYVDADDFYEKIHAVIFNAALETHKAGKPLAFSVMSDALHQVSWPEEMQSARYLARLVAEGTTLINATSYAAVIRDYAGRRKLVALREKMADMVSRPGSSDNVATMIDEIQQKIVEIRSAAREEDKVVTFKQAIAESLDAAQLAYLNESPVATLSTGLTDLDTQIGGLSPTDLIVLAGRPGSGKTAAAIGMARTAAQKEPEKSVFIFSQEMAAVQLAMREMSAAAKISSVKMRRGTLNAEEMQELVDAARSIEDLPILIDPTPATKLSTIEKTLRKYARRNPLSLVVIDYLQLMTGPGQIKAQKGNRNDEITYITAGLKSLAKELNVPILCLSQLNRQVEARDDKRPQLSDLRDSGAIEQDADLVMGIYREEYYLAARKPVAESGERWDKWKAEMDQWAGIAEFLILKSRHGATGACIVGFDGETTSFRNLDDDEKRMTPSDMVPTKVALTQAVAPAYDALVQTMEREGDIQHKPELPSDKPCIIATWAFNAYAKTRPVLDETDAEKTQKEARRDFLEALKWMDAKGLIKLHREKVEGSERTWIWMTGRKVRR
jgi:replicative DNA helicase